MRFRPRMAFLAISLLAMSGMSGATEKFCPNMNLAMSANGVTGEQLRITIPAKLTFELTGAAAKVDIESCSIYRGSTQCDPGPGGEQTDVNGTWRTEIPAVGISLGTWTRWIKINGQESNRITYTVVDSGVAVAAK